VHDGPIRLGGLVVALIVDSTAASREIVLARDLPVKTAPFSFIVQEVPVQCLFCQYLAIESILLSPTKLARHRGQAPSECVEWRRIQGQSPF
jgi:hypothetical protein